MVPTKTRLSPIQESKASSSSGSFPPLTLGLIGAHMFFAAIVLLSGAAAYGFCQGENGYLETMAFYGVYHSDPMNQLIHFFFVPCILWSMIIMMAHAPLLPVSISLLPGIPTHLFSWASVALCLYVVFYLTIDILGAMIYFPVLYAMYWTSVSMYQADQKQSSSTSWTGTGRLVKRALLLHLAGWYFQIHPGHKVFEGSQPAIMQSLGGALTSAPLFAFYEGVWALGIRRDLQQTVLVRVDELRHDLCAQGVQMRKCPAPSIDADIKTAKVEL